MKMRTRRVTRKRAFFMVMDAKSDEMQKFASAVFDGHAQVKTWIIYNEFQRGSGVWGEELNEADGKILYLTELNVKPEFRGRGVGSWIIKQFEKTKGIGHFDFVVGWVVPTKRLGDQNEWNDAQAKFACFYRKNGFRRIGRTEFFDYATNPAHASRYLSALADCDPVPWTRDCFPHRHPQGHRRRRRRQHDRRPPRAQRQFCPHCQSRRRS
ncbi:hypothetical protein BOTBODRAFT_64581 [Botryobasidium botryosum FD-172 SS1]|uniref:N-acetyltransferase domain-containing protein n=1 Tax=Botryobasidium botryosum (strain FD-172 SS1) TaxID=930990 RepID=A0A067MYI7_BOTB1|nr:hypothetical protein BOTBODRAFT_64581 [Botryobasidium botryosum FD-172 SS1]